MASKKGDWRDIVIFLVLFPIITILQMWLYAIPVVLVWSVFHWVFLGGFERLDLLPAFAIGQVTWKAGKRISQFIEDWKIGKDFDYFW